MRCRDCEYFDHQSREGKPHHWCKYPHPEAHRLANRDSGRLMASAGGFGQGPVRLVVLPDAVAPKECFVDVFREVV